MQMSRKNRKMQGQKFLKDEDFNDEVLEDEEEEQE